MRVVLLQAAGMGAAAAHRGICGADRRGADGQALRVCSWFNVMCARRACVVGPMWHSGAAAGNVCFSHSKCTGRRSSSQHTPVHALTDLIILAC